MFSQIDGFVGKRRLARREKEKKEKKSKLIKLANKKNPDREKKIRISKKPPTSDNVIKWVRKDILEKAMLSPAQITLLGQKLSDRGYPPDILTVDEFIQTIS